jgi:hypothetical protein
MRNRDFVEGGERRHGDRGSKAFAYFTFLNGHLFQRIFLCDGTYVA